MSTNLTETDAFPTPVVAPTGADVRNSASVRTPLQSLTSRTAYLRKRHRELALANWSQRSPAATGTPLEVRSLAARDYIVGDVAATDPLIAVLRTSGASKVQISADGITWIDSSASIAHEIYDCCYFGGIVARWILASSAGRIYYRDAAVGGAWTLVSGTGADFTAVAASETLAVAVGVGGRISSSANGSVWTSRVSGSTEDLVDVAYGNGVFVAAGSGSTILTSPDGVTWTSRRSSPATTAPSRVVYDELNDRFLVFSKPGGAPRITAFAPASPGTITTITVPWTVRSLAYGAGVVLGVGDSWSVHSVDGGAHWSDPSIVIQPTDDSHLNGVTWSPSLHCFVAGGGIGVIAPILAQSMRTS